MLLRSIDWNGKTNIASIAHKLHEGELLLGSITLLLLLQVGGLACAGGIDDLRHAVANVRRQGTELSRGLSRVSMNHGHDGCVR